MSRRHVAATNRFVCTGEICENLCRCNRILSPQQVAQIQSDLIFCDLLQRQNSVAETKIFTKILQYTLSDLSLRRVASPCCCNLLPDLFTWSDLSLRRVAATCRLVCTDLNQRTKSWDVRTVKVSKNYGYIWILMAKIFKLRVDDDDSIAREVPLEADDPRLIDILLPWH